jgi:hypothetical protein
VAIARDLRLLIAAIAAIAGIGGGLALRGPIRFLVLLAGLLVAAYLLGLLPHLAFLPEVEPIL